MLKPLIHDPLLLARKSEIATVEDKPIATDLLDTLKSHHEDCVGIAANMIGEQKRIIAFVDGDTYTVMFNAEITKCSEPYNTEEGCLSLLGGPRLCKRYQKITVRWQNEHFQTRIKISAVSLHRSFSMR